MKNCPAAIELLAEGMLADATGLPRDLLLQFLRLMLPGKLVVGSPPVSALPSAHLEHTSACVSPPQLMQGAKHMPPPVRASSSCTQVNTALRGECLRAKATAWRRMTMAEKRQRGTSSASP